MKHKFNFSNRVSIGGSTVVDTPISKRSQVSNKCRLTVGRLSALLFALFLCVGQMWAWTVAGEGLPGLNNPGDGWNIHLEMSDRGNNLYSRTFYSVPASSGTKYRFKIFSGSDWQNERNADKMDNDQSDVTLSSTGNKNISFDLSATKNVTIWYNNSTQKVYVKVSDPTPECPSNLYAVGTGIGENNAVGWNAGSGNSIPMNTNFQSQGVLWKKLKLFKENYSGDTEEFKFLCQQDWGWDYGSTINGHEEITTPSNDGNGYSSYNMLKQSGSGDNDRKWRTKNITEGWYNIVLDFTTTTPKMYIFRTKMYLDYNGNRIESAEIDSNGDYEFSGLNITSGSSFKFCLKSGGGSTVGAGSSDKELNTSNQSESVTLDGSNNFKVASGKKITSLKVNLASRKVTVTGIENDAPAEKTRIVAGNYNNHSGTNWCNSKDWSVNAPENKMTSNGDGTYSITYTNLPSSGTAYEFKITDGAWGSGHEFTDRNTTCDGQIATDGGGNNVKFSLSSTADVTITIDANDKICVTKSSSGPEPLSSNDYYLRGDLWQKSSGNGWTDDTNKTPKFTKNAANTEATVWYVMPAGLTKGRFEFYDGSTVQSPSNFWGSSTGLSGRTTDNNKIIFDCPSSPKLLSFNYTKANKLVVTATDPQLKSGFKAKYRKSGGDGTWTEINLDANGEAILSNLDNGGKYYLIITDGGNLHGINWYGGLYFDMTNSNVAFDNKIAYYSSVSTGDNYPISSIAEPNGVFNITGGNTDVKVKFDGGKITITKAVAQKYKVAFYDGDTELTELAQQVSSGGHATKPADPTKSGYNFLGWSETQGGTTPVDVTSFTINAAKNFYAIWHQFTIAAVLDDDEATVTPTLPEHHGALMFCYTVLDNNNQPLAEQPKITVNTTTGAGTFTVLDGAKKVQCKVHNGANCNAEPIATITTPLVADKWYVHINTTELWPDVELVNGSATIALTKEQTYQFKIKKVDASSNVTWYTDGNASTTISPCMTEDNNTGWAFSQTNTNYQNTQILAAANGDYVFSITTNNSYPDVSVAYPTSYTVTFDMQYHGEQVDEQKHIASGEKAVQPATPADVTGWHFVDWYKEQACTNVFNFETETITANTTIYAKWEKAVTSIAIHMEGDKHKNLNISETNQLYVTYTPEGATYGHEIASWESDNGNIISVSNTGLATAKTSGTAKITATTTNGVKAEYSITVNQPQCDGWYVHMWLGSRYTDYCLTLVEGSQYEMHTTDNVILPSASDAEQITICHATFTPEHQATWNVNWVPMIGQQNGNCKHDNNPYYAGQDAVGYFRIYNNNDEPNYHLAFQPTYVAVYGQNINDQSKETQLEFHNTGGANYETDPFQVPNGYKDDESYKYYVGTKRAENSTQSPFIWDGKSSVDPIRQVGGLSGGDMSGKWGTFHIYDNYCNPNFYCEFIRYYRLSYSGEGTEAYNPQYVKYSGDASARTVTLGQVPDKTGYNPNGWKIGGTSYAAGANYTLTDDATADAQWTAKIYNVTLNKGTKGTANGSATATYDSKTLSITTHVGTPAGYTLEGYYTANEGGSKVCDANGTLVANVDGYTGASGNWTKDGDAMLYAHWTPNTTTPYTVNHYQQNADNDEYTLAETDNLTGTTDTQVTPDRKSYEGFDAPAGQQVTINGDGSTEVNYNYTRKVNNVTYTDQGEGWTYGAKPESAKYGATVNFVVTPETGYEVTVSSTDAVITKSGTDYSFTMPNKAVLVTVSAEFTAQLTLDAAPAIAAPNAEVTVTPDLSNFPTDIMICYALYEGSVADANKVDVDFTINKTDHKGQATFTAPAVTGTYIVKADVHRGDDCSDETILASEEATVTVATYTVTLKDDETTLGTVEATYGNPMPEITVPTKFGYIFRGYYTEKNGGGIQYYTGTGASARTYDKTTDLTLYANWETETLYVMGNKNESNHSPWPQKWTKDKSADHLMTLDDGEYTKTYKNVYGSVQFKLYNQYTTEHTNRQVVDTFATSDKHRRYHDCVRRFYAEGGGTGSSTNINIEVASESDITIHYSERGIWVTGVKSHVNIAERTNWYLMGSGNLNNQPLNWNKQQEECWKMEMENGVAKYHAHDVTGIASFKCYDDPNKIEYNVIYMNPSRCVGGVEVQYAGGTNDNINWKRTTGSDKPYEMDICWDGYDIWVEAYILVHFNSNGGSAVDDARVVRGETMTAPTEPTKDGYKFVGWYTTEELTTPFDFNVAPAQNMTLYAKWKPLTNIFTYEGDNYLWSNTANWSENMLPDAEMDVTIQAKAIVDVKNAAAKTIVIDDFGHDAEIEILSTGALQVEGTIKRTENGSDFGPTTIHDLYIHSDASGTGALVFDNSNGCKAYVEMYSKAYLTVDGSGKKTKYWQYLGAPVSGTNLNYDFYGAYTYLYGEVNGGWTRVKNGEMTPWKGWGITQDKATTYLLNGTLQPTSDQEITLTYTEGGAKGDNLLANSWMAPIDITKMETDDFGGATATLYMYNTGRDPVYGQSTYGDGTNDEPGQWVTIPVNAAKETEWKGPKAIPSMQVFEILTDKTTTLTLDYDKVVRHKDAAIGTDPLRAPARKADNEDAVSMMRIRVEGQNMHVDQYLLEGENFTTGFDNGWDGNHVEGDGRSAGFYSVNSELGNMAVNALPEIEGTLLGFVPNDEQAFTISFGYNGDKTYYLNDLIEQKSTLIRDDQTYFFLVGGNDLVHRFQISTTPFESYIGTGSDNIGDGVQKAVKFIENDKLFILRNGRLYDGTGKALKPGK